ncbi:ras-domain-containing protein [Hanseniaspora valbyensis NRRL Y-1626]|uniref:Ras-related protein SEC4 n=1 Tax=Hanseniaspora valbyensis NRRL Y-1626 TaxID=766949 RepID=A0A1B7TGX7_9ASCO|nr:ras-domain-containing protein [Hanseniaspora valbyensis NRRL Y-1626]
MSSSNFHAMRKILLIGDSGVGKSCLLVRFVDDTFSPSFITTIGIDFKIKTIDINGKKIKLQLWDTAGQERFRTITTAYYRGADGVVLVYDVQDEKTFADARDVWYNTIMENALPECQLILVGNKADVDSNEAGRAVSFEEGESLAKSLGMAFVEASAKTNKNVDEVFFTLVKMIEEKLEGKEGANTSEEKKKSKSEKVNLKSSKKSKSSDCC